MSLEEPSLEVFLARSPKVDLHLHLVGSASIATVTELAARAPDVGVPTEPDQLATFLTFVDFPHFIDVYSAVTSLVRGAEDIAALVRGAAADLAAQQVPYAEMTVTPYMHTVRGLPYEAVLEGLADGRRDAAALGVELVWIFDIPGQYGQPGARETLRGALEQPPDGLIGFGLAGAEAGVDRTEYAWAFAQARAAGLHAVPHAGEGDGPTSIWAAIRALGAERIGHGVRAVEDPALVEHLVDTQIPLEVCPSSNVCTRVFPSLADHSIKPLLEAGVFITVNTDDPPMFSTTLDDEYRRLAATFGFDVERIAALVRNGVRASFLAEERQRELLRGIDDALAVATQA